MVTAVSRQSRIGQEVSVPNHLQDGQEFSISVLDLLEHGRLLFVANWTIQEGGGRPLTKGTGNPLNDPLNALRFPRNFNRISATDANSCADCHNTPFGIPGGGGDFVANVFVRGQRFDFATFDGNETRRREVPSMNAVRRCTFRRSRTRGTRSACSVPDT
jgi:hypothetical protein